MFKDTAASKLTLKQGVPKDKKKVMLKKHCFKASFSLDLTTYSY